VGNNIGHVFVFDLFGEKKMNRIESHGKIVRSICFTCDSLKLISVSDDLHINIIDL
jgi:WD40 repeat protein